MEQASNATGRKGSIAPIFKPSKPAPHVPPSWYIAKNIPYHEAVARLRSSWEEGVRCVYGEKIEHFEDLINPQLWWQANLEWREERAMPVPAKHPDIGYRVLLAQTLARVGPEEQRVDLVDHFYDIFYRDRFD